MAHLLWLIPAAPALGVIWIALFSRRCSAHYAAFIATLMVGISALSVALLWCTVRETTVYLSLYTWMSVGLWAPRFAFYIDKISLIMLTVATGVGFLIHLFSVHFMKNSSGIRRYFLYLNLFIVGMVCFVMADNLVLLYLGWEIMGLCSYALVAYYYKKPYYAYCGRKAFVVTRIGDAFLAIAILVVFFHFKTVEISSVFQQIQTHSDDAWLIGMLCVLFLVAGIAKSAQFPMHIWLPDAMTGPSTVSALIHAATMVTAGVYLLVRFHVLLDRVPDIRLCIAFIGGITAFFAASAALAQNEIKRVLAYSTISQIGYMFAAIGVGAYSLALFHLLVHACFKALLFMSSGVIVHAFGEISDLRKMGGLIRHQPILHAVYLVGVMTLSALPFITASFYSKEAIIAADFTAPYGWILSLLGIVGAFLTGLYAMRMYIMIFWGKARSMIQPYTLTFVMKLPLLILAFLSITIGWIQVPERWTFGPHWLVPWLALDLGWNPMPMGATAVWFEWVGILVVLASIMMAIPLTKAELCRQYGLSNCAFLRNAWYTDALSFALFVRPYFFLCWLCSMFETIFLKKGMECGLIYVFNQAHESIKYMQANTLRSYLYGFILGTVILLAYLIRRLL